jgi:hypothetical protein
MARARIDNVKDALDRARLAMDKAKTSYAAFGATQATATAGGMAGAGVAAAAVAGGGRRGGSTGFQNTGMSVLYASQAVEDLQYGVRAVLNNIPLLVMGLGGGAGLAGVISLAAVAASQLSERFKNVTESTKTLDQAVAESAKEKQKERIKQLETEPSSEMDRQTKAVRALYKSGDAREFATQLVDSQPIDRQLNEKERRFRTESRYRASSADSPEDRDKYDAAVAKIESAARERAIKATIALIAGAETDPAKLNALSQLTSQSGDARKAQQLQAAAMPQGFNQEIARLVIKDAKEMTDDAAFKTLIAESERLQRAFDGGSISAIQLNESLDEIAKAMRDVSDKAADSANAAMALAAAEKKLADDRKEAWRKAAQNENTSAAERMSGQAAGMYGNAFGGQIAGAMQRAALKGENDSSVNDRLQTQLEARMKNLPPSLRSMAARQVIEQARMQQQGMAVMGAAGNDIASAGIAANLAPPNTRMGIMQRQMLAKQGMIGGQFAARAQDMAGQVQNSPEARQLQAGETMDKAASKFMEAVDKLDKRGLQIIL